MAVVLTTSMSAGAVGVGTTNGVESDAATVSLQGLAVASGGAAVDPLNGSTQSIDVLRFVESERVEPGGSTEITVEVNAGNKSTVQITETFDRAFADVEVVETSPFPVVQSSRTDNTAITGIWEDVETVSFTYEVTVPEDAVNGDEFDITSETTIDGRSTSVFGPDTITVVDPETRIDATATRRIGSEVLSPGESTEVTIDVTTESARTISVSETFDPEFSNVRIVEEGGLSGPRSIIHTNTGMAAVWSDKTSASVTYEVTVPDDARADERFNITSNTQIDGRNVTVSGPTTIRVRDIVARYENTEGKVDTPNLRTAVDDWSAGDLTTRQIVRVIEAWSESG